MPDQLKECGGIGSHVGREIGADPADLSAGADQAAIGVPHQLLHCRRAVGLLDSALECLATVVNGRVVGPSAGEVQRILLAIFHLACSPDVALVLPVRIRNLLRDSVEIAALLRLHFGDIHVHDADLLPGCDDSAEQTSNTDKK